LTEIYHLLGMKSSRGDLIDRMKTGWGCFVLASPRRHMVPAFIVYSFSCDRIIRAGEIYYKATVRSERRGHLLHLFHSQKIYTICTGDGKTVKHFLQCITHGQIMSVVPLGKHTRAHVT
jgi:hypothetical protein